jgi:uncharacterized protein YggU (UPF0235/DUF167 family)
MEGRANATLHGFLAQELKIPKCAIVIERDVFPEIRQLV